MCIFKKPGDTQTHHPGSLKLKFFNMVKVTKSSPASKRNGVKKVCRADYKQLTNVNLTAMPFRVAN